MDNTKGILSGRRILVVEDEAAISLMFVDILSSAGCMVVGPASSAAEALAYLEREEVHCAVLDVQLTDGTAHPVAEALAKRGIPYVLATAFAQAELGELEAPKVLRKTFMPHEVIEAIADVLRP
jgi:CheY-like chemotaxis protein